MLIASAIAALFLASVHFFASKLRFSQIPRSKWLSAAGGVSVSYVFIHLLPELEEWQRLFEEENRYNLSFISHHLYLVSLIGLCTFYGVERAAKLSYESSRKSGTSATKDANREVFHLHIISFSLYNALIGYLLVHRDTDSYMGLFMFAMAMAFHFIVNDYALLDHYRHQYIKEGRWIVTLSILGGWAMGVFTEVSEVGLAILFALVSGSIVLNVLKEELPEERKSNYWAFLLGVILYSSLLLLS